MAVNEELRLEFFMCFFKFSEDNRRITKMAQALGVEKYEMSRQVAQLEKEGYVDRSDPGIIGISSGASSTSNYRRK